MADETTWLDPDSLLDDVSTGVLGVAAGFVFGFLATVVLLPWLDSAVGLLAWPVGWVGAALYVGWNRSVVTATRKAGSLLGPTVAATPLALLAPSVETGSLAGTALGVALAAAVALPLGGLLVGVGRWVGERDPEG